MRKNMFSQDSLSKPTTVLKTPNRTENLFPRMPKIDGQSIMQNALLSSSTNFEVKPIKKIKMVKS